MCSTAIKKWGFVVLVAILGAVWVWRMESPASYEGLLSKGEIIGVPTIRSSYSPKNPDDATSRALYELRRLRDPKTGKIPKNIREKELKFAKKLPKIEDYLAKTASTTRIASTWQASGPFNVGGRTRALAIDQDFNGTSNRKILAGGISGGMYISEDNGQTWNLTSSMTGLASVSSIAQDPTNSNIWYYGTGEGNGNSARLTGRGIFKSQDGGRSWTQLPSTIQNSDVYLLDSVFDLVWNVKVHPETGAVFAAIYGRILRSTDSGNSWVGLLTGKDAQGNWGYITDIDIASNGEVYATISRNGSALNPGEFGVFQSTDDGDHFTNISPTNLAQDPYRMVLDVAASDPSTVYLLAQIHPEGAIAQHHQFFRYNAGNGSWTDLSSAIPDEAGLEGNASFSSQTGYDLIVYVKPDNPDVVWIGGTNLYRSTNGGQSFSRVGGYLVPENYSPFENHHSDQHSMAFYPTDANKMISGHDGGLSLATDALEYPQTWISLNNGYNTTQFYAIDADPQAGGNLIVGGMQDNGNWGTDSQNPNDPWVSVLGGDGGYSAITPGGVPFYVSTQQGNVIRFNLVNDQWHGSAVAPEGAQNYVFIAPYVLDPNDMRVMYIAADSTVWRNSNLDDIPIGNPFPTSINWMQLSNSAVSNMQVTALAVSKSPANRLYFGATDYRTTTAFVRVDNPAVNPGGITITPPGLTRGSQPSCIAINPANADEIIVTVSSYNVPSVFYSTNGGNSWTNIDGNLANGPSVRWAVITPTGQYFLATSIGVFSSTSINGANTSWLQEGASTIGNVVVDMIDYRESDGQLLAGTHGRGVYKATVGGGTGTAHATVSAQRLSISAKPGETGSSIIRLSNDGTGPMSFTARATGQFSSTPASSAKRVAILESSKEYTGLSMTGGERKGNSQVSSVFAQNAPYSNNDAAVIQGDILYLDDGNDLPDKFLGFDNGIDFYWRNDFHVQGSDFKLENIHFYMQTQTALFNNVSIAVNDANGTVLDQGVLSYGLASNGAWFQAVLNPPITFRAGETFQLVIGAFFINFPAGVDTNASVPSNSYYWDNNQFEYINLNTISGFENGAFLVRAGGSFVSTQNQNPVAKASVTPSQAKVNETITFDASASYDPDGQITQYKWNFGDGSTSNQMVATHAYSQAGTYAYTLTVTDNNGATGQTSGQVNITETAQNQNPVAKASVTPSQAEVNETITFDASASYDPDGQITQYKWNFGDSSTNNQMVATHAYSQAGTYTYTLTVTDNNGATGQTSGQVNITETANQRLTVIPSSGNIAAGSYQELTVTVDAQGLAEGNYTGELFINTDGGNFNIPLDITVNNVTSLKDEEKMPANFALSQNYPNPFNPETTIEYEIPQRTDVSIRIYNLRGQLVATLVNEKQSAGRYKTRWDGKDKFGQFVSTGVYIYQIKAGDFLSSRKLTLLK